MADEFPPEWHPRIMHAYLVADEVVLMGGEVSMPLERAFWAERFGMLVDRYGTPWMVNYEGSIQYVPEAPAGAAAESPSQPSTPGGGSR